MVELPNVLAGPESIPRTATDNSQAGSCGDDELFPHLLHELLQPPKGLLIHGPPGTGKSKLMHALAEVVQAIAMTDDATADSAGTADSAAAPQRAVHVPVHVLEISHAMLLGKYEGDFVVIPYSTLPYFILHTLTCS